MGATRPAVADVASDKESGRDGRYVGRPCRLRGSESAGRTLQPRATGALEASSPEVLTPGLVDKASEERLLTMSEQRLGRSSSL